MFYPPAGRVHIRTAAKPLVPYPEGCSRERPGSNSVAGGGGDTVDGGGPAAGHSATLQTPAPGADPSVRLCPACCGHNGVLVWEPCGQLPRRQHSVTETSAPALDDSHASRRAHLPLYCSSSTCRIQDVNTTISDCCFAGAGAGQPRAAPAAAGHRRRHAKRGVAACAPAAVCVRRPLRRCVCVTSAKPTQHLAQFSSLLLACMQASAAKQHSTEPGTAASQCSHFKIADGRCSEYG